jgi:hypothetical protein
MVNVSKQYDFWSDYSFFKDPVIKLSGFYTKIDYKLPIFRARIYDGFDIANRKELQYPPKELCRFTGRANVPTYPVFYGSYDKDCAIRELKLKEEKVVVISEWRWKENLSLSVKLFSKMEVEYESILQKYNVRTIKEYVDLCYSKYGKHKHGDLHFDMIKRMSAMCDLFLNEEDYFGSAIVGFEELYRPRLSKNMPRTDVLIYPSISNPQSLNLAIHPEIVDNFLEFKAAYIKEIKLY